MVSSDNDRYEKGQGLSVSIEIKSQGSNIKLYIILLFNIVTGSVNVNVKKSLLTYFVLGFQTVNMKSFPIFLLIF
mgnify:FL=1